MAYTVDEKGTTTKSTSDRQEKKKVASKAPTWPLPHGEAQGPRPNPNIPNKVNIT